jgi:hypothetical protein
MKHLKLFEEFEPIYFSDALRMDIMEEFLVELKRGDQEFLEEHEDDPDTDMLLDPHEGYDKQTYIQYKDKKVIYWEGWSDYCWKSLYDKDEYKGLSKEAAIRKVIKERLIVSMEELGLKYIDNDYWFEQSWSDGIEDGYIMKITFEIK